MAKLSRALKALKAQAAKQRPAAPSVVSEQTPAKKATAQKKSEKEG